MTGKRAVQYYLGGNGPMGPWKNAEDRTDYFLGLAADKNRCSINDVITKLQSGEQVYFRAEWDAMIRMLPVQKPAPTIDLSRPDRPAYDWYER